MVIGKCAAFTLLKASVHLDSKLILLLYLQNYCKLYKTTVNCIKYICSEEQNGKENSKTFFWFCFSLGHP